MNNVKNINRDKPSKTRREFIKGLTAGIGYIAVGSFTLSAINSCSNDNNPASPEGGTGNPNAKITIDISKQENQALATVGGTIAISGNALDSNGMLIVRSDQTNITALSRTCTHQGCTIPKFSSGISSCPCHGSQFNTSGGVVKGPATSSLRKYNAVIDGNIITITA